MKRLIFLIALAVAGCSVAAAQSDDAFDFECHPVRLLDTTSTRCENRETVCYFAKDYTTTTSVTMSCIRKP